MRTVKLLLLFSLCLQLSGCLASAVGTVVGVAVDTTIEVAKVPFKVAGAAVDLALPDDDKDNDDED